MDGNRLFKFYPQIYVCVDIDKETKFQIQHDS
jgi:hypothetical protein